MHLKWTQDPLLWTRRGLNIAQVSLKWQKMHQKSHITLWKTYNINENISIYLLEPLLIIEINGCKMYQTCYVTFQKATIRLERYRFFSSTIYRQTYIVISDSIVIICFSFTHDCFTAENNRYVPFYTCHNQLQIHLHSVYLLLKWFAFVSHFRNLKRLS